VLTLHHELLSMLSKHLFGTFDLGPFRELVIFLVPASCRFCH